MLLWLYKYHNYAPPGFHELAGYAWDMLNSAIFPNPGNDDLWDSIYHDCHEK